MIDLEKLKPILQEIVPEDSIPDAILKVTEIDEAMDDRSEDLRKANEEIQKLKESNKKLSGLFFSGQKEENTNPLPDKEDEEDEEKKKETFDDLFETKEYERGVDELNG